MNITILDAKTLGDDLDLNVFKKFGELKVHDFTWENEVVDHIKEQDIIITNKIKLNEENLSQAPSVKLICVTATGTNNIDIEYCKKNNIAVTNVAGYSTNSVAQHTFSMLFYLLEHLPYYDNYVKSGKYVDDEIFTHFAKKFNQINDKTWGIIGLGAIGKKVATIAKAFGCNIIYYSTTGKNYSEEFSRVDLDYLLKNSDIISIHAPLTDDTRDLIKYEEFEKMKDTAIVLNLGRGSIINEADIVKAINDNQVGAVGLDVLEYEPIKKDNPLLTIGDSDRLLITPHIAWASVEARQLMIEEVLFNIDVFIQGKKRNRVDL